MCLQGLGLSRHAGPPGLEAPLLPLPSQPDRPSALSRGDAPGVPLPGDRVARVPESGEQGRVWEMEVVVLWEGKGGAEAPRDGYW